MTKILTIILLITVVILGITIFNLKEIDVPVPVPPIPPDEPVVVIIGKVKSGESGIGVVKPGTGQAVVKPPKLPWIFD